jgi:hypothetical protein
MNVFLRRHQGKRCLDSQQLFPGPLCPGLSRLNLRPPGRHRRGELSPGLGAHFAFLLLRGSGIRSRGTTGEPIQFVLQGLHLFPDRDRSFEL